MPDTAHDARQALVLLVLIALALALAAVLMAAPTRAQEALPDQVRAG